MNRLATIRLRRTGYGWVWADHGGWGSKSYKRWTQALRAALSGEK